MKELHIRGGWIRIKQVVFGFLEELAEKRGWQIHEDLPDDFPRSSGWIKLFAHTINDPLAKIELQQIGNADWLSLKWQSLADGMDRVFEDLESELRGS